MSQYCSLTNKVTEMNKQEFVLNLKEWANKFNIDLKDVWVSHGGALLMHGLKETTEDIDLNGSKSMVNDFKAKGYESKRITEYVELISFGEIDLHNAVRPRNNLVEIDGILVVSLEKTLKDYLKLNRPKDQKWIEVIKKELRKREREKVKDVYRHLGRSKRPRR